MRFGLLGWVRFRFVGLLFATILQALGKIGSDCLLYLYLRHIFYCLGRLADLAFINTKM